MKLARAASFFNRTEFTDAYTGAAVCKGQLLPYSDSTRDSVTAQRRVISLAPGTVLPARRVLAAAGQRFILGETHTDIFGASAVRLELAGQEAPLDLTLQTLAQACDNEAGRVVFGNRAWIKNAAFTEQTSTLVPEYQFYVSASEAAVYPGLLASGADTFLIRSRDELASGLSALFCELLPSGAVFDTAIQVATFDQVQGANVTTVQAARGVKLRWQSLFTYGDKQAPKFGADESVVVFSRSLPKRPTEGSTFAAAGVAYRVTAVRDTGTHLQCRVVEQ